MKDARGCLDDVPPEKVFRFANGNSARNLYELLTNIKGMSQAQFEEHSNPEKDDFIKWIIDVVGDMPLSACLKKAKTKSGYEEIIDRRLTRLEKSAWLRCTIKSVLIRLGGWYDEKALAFVLFSILFISLGLIASLCIGLDQRLDSIEQTTAELKESDVWVYSQLVQGLSQLRDVEYQPLEESPSNIDELFYHSNPSAPADQLSEEQIYVYGDKIVLSLDNATLARFLDTGSMIPTFDEDANSIEIPVSVPEDISVGDIIVYASPDQGEPIIHRVVEIGEDDEGWYAITQGDNNNLADPRRVRFGDIKRIVVGVIY